MLRPSTSRLVVNKTKATRQTEEWYFEKNSREIFEKTLQSSSFFDRDTLVTLCKGKVTERLHKKSVESSDDESGLSVDGSPLKLQQFDVSCVSASNGKHVDGILPMSAVDARRLLPGFIAHARERAAEELPPLLVYCDAAGPEALALLGLAVTEQSGNHACSCVSYKVSSKGPYPYQKKEKLPNVASLLNKHFPQNYKVSTQYRAEYDVMGAQKHDVSVLSSHAMTSLTLKTEWAHGTTLLQTPPLNADTIVEAVVCTGDMRSAAHTLFTELTALLGLAAGLKEGLVKWAVDSSEIPLLDRVNQLVEEVQSGSAQRLRDAAQEDNEDEMTDSPALALNSLVLEERRDLDFTEQLWTVLKDCSSYSELVQSLELVFQQLQAGRLQPMVHKGNRSRLAELIRASYRREMSAPALHGLTPLQLIVEIGIEKLRRDYRSAFLGKGLTVESDLEHFMTRRGSLEERVVLLDKLQHTLELVAVLSQYLSLPRTLLGTTARRTLKYYESHAIEPGHVFSLSVPANHIYTHTKSIPRLWQLEMVGEVEGTPLCALYIVTQKPLFSHTVHADRHDCSLGEVNGEEEGCSFYLTVASQSLIHV